MPLRDKFSKNQLEETKKSLEKIANIIEKINTLSEGTGDIFNASEIENYRKEIDKLYKSSPVKFSTSSTNRNTVQNRIAKLKSEIENSIYENFADNLLENEISKYIQKIEKSYDTATKKEQKKLGDRSKYIKTNTEVFRQKISELFKQTYGSERLFDESLGRETSKKDIFRIVTSASNQAESEVQEKQEQAADELGKSGKILKEAGEILKSFAGKLLGFVFQGARKQKDTYNSVYSDIAVRSNIDRSTFLKQQNTSFLGLMNTEYGNETLFDNVAMSELMESWKALVDKGLNFETAVTRGLDTVITKKIVPYLDTTSLSVTLLNEKVNGKFLQDIRGINQSNLELVGNNYATEKILNQMIDLVQPLSDEAIKNLALGSTEVTTMINDLMQNYGYSENAAIEAATNAFKMQEYSDQMIRSGSTYEKMNITSAMQHPELNLYNPADLNNFIGMNLENASLLMQGANYNSTSEGLLANIRRNAFGISYNTAQAITQNEGTNWSNVAKKHDTTQEVIEEAASKALSDFSKGKYQTATEKQLIAIENLATPLAEIEEQIGDIGIDLSKSLGLILKAIIGTGLSNTIASSLGIKGVTGGLSKLFASGGGVALGTIAGIAAIGAITTAVADGIADSKKDNARKNSSSYSNDFIIIDESTGEQIGDAKSAGAIAAYANDLGSHHSNSLGGRFLDFNENLGKNFLQTMSNAVNFNGYNLDDPTGANKEKWDRIIHSQEGNFTEEEMKWLISTYALAMLDAGNDKSLIPQVLGSGINVDGVKAFLHSYFDSDYEQASNYLTNAMTTLSKLDLYPVGPNRHFTDLKWTLEDMQNWGAYRQGLSKVPYDEYPAILHAGETIMTASTTATMESMIQAFKDGQNQNYRIDTAIQEQTAQLIAKMNEIINNMNSNIGTSTNTNSVQANLRKSLVSMTSTVGFNAYKN